MNAECIPQQAVSAQQAFASALLDPSHRLSVELRVGAGIDAQRRFAVHRNNAVVAMVDALAAAFPVTQALVGEDFFRAMACERVRIDPPHSPIITDYGDGFAEFIAGFAPADCVPYLADMARLERLCARAYNAADAAPVTAAAYWSLVLLPERLAATRLKFHPACFWMHSAYAVRSIWNAHQGIDTMADAQIGGIRIDASENILVTRPQWQVQVGALSDGGIAWLDALRAGQTLGAAMSRSDGMFDNAQLKSLLALIVERGLAVELVTPAES